MEVISNEPPYSVFSGWQKAAIVASTACAYSVLSGLTISIYYPALGAIAEDLHTSTADINLTVTVFVIMQAVAPSFWGSFADRVGRRPSYLASVFLFTVSCIGLALVPSYPALLVLRMVQALGSSPTIAIGAGIISDIIPPSERGMYFGMLSGLRNAVFTAAPVVGGVVSDRLSWRWAFWLLAISGVLSFLLILFLVPETLRSLVGNGSGYANPTPSQWLSRYLENRHRPKVAANNNDTSVAEAKVLHTTPPKLASVMVLRPIRLLFEPDAAIAILYSGIHIGTATTFNVALSSILMHIYQLSSTTTGLCYLPMGVGALTGSFVQGRILNYQYRKYTIRHFGQLKDESYVPMTFPIFHARLRPGMASAILMQIAVLSFGWCVYAHVHFGVLLVILFFTGYCFSSIFNANQTLLMDLFPKDSSSIMASDNLVRGILGAVAISVIEPGMQAIGVHWMFTTIAFILMISNILPLLLFIYGSRWRQKRADRENLANEKCVS